MCFVMSDFQLDVRISTPAAGHVEPASWTPARSRTIKCTKWTCFCSNTCTPMCTIGCGMDEPAN